MNAVTKTWLFGLATLISVGLIAPPVQGDGISGSGRRDVRIDRFGSIVHDGVHYQTHRALIRMNGVPVSENELRVGHRVFIRGDMTAHEAWTVDYYDTVAGTLESVSVRDGALQIAELRIMGQTIRTDADTWLYGAELDDLKPGMQLAVSGYWDSDGSVRASAIERKQQVITGVSGSITSLSDHGFTIGSLEVDTLYAHLQLGADELTVGAKVYVTGELGPDGFEAHAVVLIDALGIQAEQVEIEGFASYGDGAWYLNGHRLELDDAIRYVAGDAEDLAPGSRVTVRGTLSATGALRAVEMEFERSPSSRVDGHVEWVDTESGFITVDGLEIALDDDVSMRDDRDDDHWFDARGLGVSDAVSIMVEDRDGVLKAKKIVRKAKNEKRMIRAVAKGISLWSGVKIGKKDFWEVFTAGKVLIDGQEVSDWELLWKLERGHEVQLVWNDDGTLARVEVNTGAAGSNWSDIDDGEEKDEGCGHSSVDDCGDSDD